MQSHGVGALRGVTPPGLSPPQAGHAIPSISRHLAGCSGLRGVGHGAVLLGFRE